MVAAVLLALGVAACDDDDNPEPMTPIGDWSYTEGPTGPTNWGSLDPSFAVCSSGMRQSPIDIPMTAVASNQPPIELDYDSTPLVLFNNNNHTMEVEYEPGSTMRVGTSTWEVKQFHFHSRSEHTIAGQDAPLEMHIVHRNSTTGALAVLGVMIREGSENAALAPVFANLRPTAGEPERIPGVSINVADALPSELDAWRYDGSLTTPPCAEGVRWHLLEEGVEASPAQIAAYRAIFPRGARPVQALNGRVID